MALGRFTPHKGAMVGFGAAEFDHLYRARTPHVIFEKAFDDQAWPYEAANNGHGGQVTP